MVVSKKSVKWDTGEPIVTPSHVRSHIENCKEWLLSSYTPDDEQAFEEDHDVFSQTIRVSSSIQSMSNIGVLQNRIHSENAFDCFLCKKKVNVCDGRVINANPFTRAHFMMLCQTCEV